MGRCMFSCDALEWPDCCHRPCARDPSHDPGEHVCAEHLRNPPETAREATLKAELAEALSILDHLYDYDFRMPPDDWWRDDIRPRVAALLKKHGL